MKHVGLELSLGSVWACKLGQSWETGQPPMRFQFTLCTLLREQAGMYALLLSRVRASHCPPASQGDLSPLRGTPRLGQSVYSSHHSLPREGLQLCNPRPLLCHPSGHRSRPDHFSSIPDQFCVALSHSLGCTGVFLPVSS